MIEVALTRRAGRVAEDEQELLDFLLSESGRPVTWLGMSSQPKNPEATAETMARLEPLIRRGGIPQVLPKPFVVQMDLRNPFSFLFVSSRREQYLAEYVLRECGRGRSLHDVLADPYARNRSTPAERARMLERPEVVEALGEERDHLAGRRRPGVEALAGFLELDRIQRQVKGLPLEDHRVRR